MVEATDENDKAKQIQGIIPNIIHSLDASHIMGLIKNANKDKFTPIITIHDCFGTLPKKKKMGELEHRVKKEFGLLYTRNNFLSDYHKRFIQSLKDNNFKLIKENGTLFVLYDNYKL